MPLSTEEANKLVTDNIGLAYAFAHQKADVAKRHGIEFDDLLSEMMLCMTRSSREYDPLKGAVFSTWAYRWMALAVRHLLESERSPRARFRKRIFGFPQDPDGNPIEPSGGCDPNVARVDAAEFLADRWAKLTDKERTVINGRFANGETLEQVGLALGVCRERVRQIEVSALRKFRSPRRKAVED